MPFYLAVKGNGASYLETLDSKMYEPLSFATAEMRGKPSCIQWRKLIGGVVGTIPNHLTKSNQEIKEFRERKGMRKNEHNVKLPYIPLAIRRSCLFSIYPSSIDWRPCLL